MPIYTHITIGTNDLDKARDFYDKVLAPLGLKRLMNMDHGSFYGVDGPEFMVVKPRDGKPATVANGLTIGFRAPGKEAIDEFYKTALELGGTDEGAPGFRDFVPNLYAAYVRDLDGHKILASSVLAE